MAFTTKNTLIVALLCFLLIHEMEIYGSNMVEAQQIDCDEKCNSRCSKSWKPKMCLKTCNACCEKCNCVPSGPTADRDECPCYAKMRTPKGKLKCP